MSLESTRGQRIGRYTLYDQIAAGGMAAVYVGRMSGVMGFSRTVAIKRLHAHLAHDPEFVAMFLDEARLAARVQHPNVVPTLDVVARDGEIFLVLGHVTGESLSRLLCAAREAPERVPVDIAVSLASDVLAGLHAAHEAKDDRGRPLGIVHRDVSPQNVLVGVDGQARLADFGVAKAAWRLQRTRTGALKGKPAYMPPEQLQGLAVDRRADVYASSVLLWEILSGRRMFAADDIGALAQAVLAADYTPLATLRADVPAPLEALVRRGMAPSPDERFASALTMAEALHGIAIGAPRHEVASWVRRLAGDRLDARAKRLAAIELTPARIDDAVEAVLSPHARRQLVDAVTAADAPVALAPRARRWVAWCAGAAVMMAAGVSIVARLRASTAAERLASSSSPSAVEPPRPPTAIADVPTATVETSHVGPPAPTVVRSRPQRATPRKPPIERSAARDSRDCDPPFFFDASGTKRPKPQCM